MAEPARVIGDPTATVAVAHSRPVAGGMAYEPMADHERLVADGDLAAGLPGAATFAGAFGVEELGRLLGRWHDLGKYSVAFQSYIRCDPNAPVRDQERVDHSTAGARHAIGRDAVVGKLLAYAIAGHHAGLPDEGVPEQSGTLAGRIDKHDPVINDAFVRAPKELLELNISQQVPVRPLEHGIEQGHAAGFGLAFFVRMLFSCLVDADYLATAWFMDPDPDRARRADVPPLATLLGRLRPYIETRSALARGAGAANAVLDARDSVLRDARAAAAKPPGFMTFTVPTGGGKTLAGMDFALDHAIQHGLRRVVVAVPYTSIIDQNAAVYREALGDDAVLEHHSNLDPDRETPWQRLTAENWDAPVVVTTTVQLFESLFAGRPGTCRKLHRLARSVIVLDEAQMLPVTLLTPLLAALRELVSNYGCTVVLCTATQPALGHRANFRIGLPLAPDREIVSNTLALFAALRRTRVRAVGVLDDDAIIDRLLREPRALCIVNTRRHAAGLYAKLGQIDPNALHLSALMCPVHRRETIAEICDRLRSGKTCRVLSTQVIEAGVDVDFPVVLRALAGMDSIAQSAGRCNREGRLATGDVEVFEPRAEAEGGLPSSIEQARNAAAQVLPAHADDPLGPSAIEHYFQLLYWSQTARWDAKRIMECFCAATSQSVTGARTLTMALNFRTAAERFTMIERGQVPVIIPYGSAGTTLLAELQRTWPPTRQQWRMLQRLTVNVPKYAASNLAESGVIASLRPGESLDILTLTDPGGYDRRMGLRLDSPGIDPSHLVT